MKKQYRIVERHWPYYNIILYHDGVEVEIRDSDQLVIGMDTDKLESEGYTYGYTEEKIEKARKAYEKMAANRIGPDAETYDGEWLVGGKCTACNNYSHIRTKYCPNCGAKMKGAK